MLIQNKLLQTWQNLTFREKLLVLVFFLVVLPVLILKFAIFPVIKKADTAYLEYTTSQQDLIKFNSDLKSYNELKEKNKASGFDFQAVLDELLKRSGIDERPDISQEKSDVFGNNYILRFAALRTDQIFRFIYQLENSLPPVIIDKIETAESIQKESLSSLTLIVKTE